MSKSTEQSPRCSEPKAPAKGRIEISCPECGNQQIEPALVISTQCRACGAHFRVADGKSVVRKRPSAKFGGKTLQPETTKPEPALGISPLTNLRVAATNPEPGWISRFFSGGKQHRDVRCFSCKHRFSISKEAQSTQCPKCSHYISLLDYEIAESWVRRIETGGNVIIRKTGRVHGASIRCHSLTVQGEMTGSVECTGDFILRTHGRIIGSVHCESLRVEKGAKVEFLHPVHASSVRIDGEVRGPIICTGPVILEKRAKLIGLVRTTSLVIKPGATHSGSIEMIPTA